MIIFDGIFLLITIQIVTMTECSYTYRNSGIIKNNGTYDIFNCCAKVFGSCRTSCANLSLVRLASVDSNSRANILEDVKKFCPSMQIEFWNCMNQTLQAISQGSQWSGRKCCSIAVSPICQNLCATSSSQDELSGGCRKSDEQRLFTCFHKQEMADECCGNSRTSECLQACKDIFEQGTNPFKEYKKHIDNVCSGRNERVLQCVYDFFDFTPMESSKQYLPCCDYSSNEQCRSTCKQVLTARETIQEVIDGLESGGCGPPLPHDPLWQCFLSTEKKIFIPSSSSEVSQINQVGMDSAKLHCCHKAVAPKCRRLCVQTFSNDWTTRNDFDIDCLLQINEIELRRCIDEVDEPCELGCDGLSFCTNFNNRPTELFRSCQIQADIAARSDVEVWKKMGFLSLPGLKLPIKNISNCSPEMWRAIACTLQIKPCTKGTHFNQICREDCYEILSKCMDWTRLESGLTASSLCSKFSPDGDNVPCISIKPYLEPSDAPLNTGGHHKLTSPCKGHPCNATEVCISNRNESIGYQCIPGCPLGEASSYWVPLGAYVRVPVSSAQNGCLKVCRCNISGRLEHCQPLPCFTYDHCNLGGRRIEHASWFYVECNICSCFAGEITCTKKQCRIPGISDHSYTSLPCNCPAHYVPVCAKNGNTYHSSCIAKCTGLQDSDIEFGACRSRDPCKERPNICPIGTMCVEDRKICLSVMHKPCLQYRCVNISKNCTEQNQEPACDINGTTFKTACHLFNSKTKFSYFGHCFRTCSHNGPVCGINGVTYNNECEAWSDYSLIDYNGNCREVGLLASDMGIRCHNIKCEKFSSLSSYCQKIIPPGACCPICSSAFRVMFSRKQIDRALYALNRKNMDILTLKSILRSLDSLIQISECQLSGFLTMETDLFVTVQNREKFPNSIQIEACTREAEKLASLITTQSHKVTSNLALSTLTVANMVKPNIENCAIHNIQLNNLNFFILLFFACIFHFKNFFIFMQIKIS